MHRRGRLRLAVPTAPIPDAQRHPGIACPAGHFLGPGPGRLSHLFANETRLEADHGGRVGYGSHL